MNPQAKGPRFHVRLAARCVVTAWLCSWVAMIAIAIVAIAVSGCGASGDDARAAGGGGGVSLQHVSGPPFGVAVTPKGHYAFVDLVGGRVLVYSLARDVPALVRTIVVPGEAVGSSLTRDGRFLLVADGQGAAVLSVARAERGAAHVVLGTLRPPPSRHLGAAGAIETTSSADGRYVFVSLEYGSSGGAVAVYDLGKGPTPRIGAANYVGAITLGDAVVGSALSPDGRYLYVTSEIAGNSLRVGRSDRQSHGSLSVLDVNAAERGLPSRDRFLGSGGRSAGTGGRLASRVGRLGDSAGQQQRAGHKLRLRPSRNRPTSSLPLSRRGGTLDLTAARCRDQKRRPRIG